jgi:glycerol-3-phosphate responsive antiterminator
MAERTRAGVVSCGLIAGGEDAARALEAAARLAAAGARV